MIVVGIDIGGTKIEVQSFDADWSIMRKRRVATPQNYDSFIAAIVDQVRWAMDGTSSPVPIGISSAGYSNPTTGTFLAANLPASGKPFLNDATTALGKAVTLINDARAFTQSEAVFGAAVNDRVVAGVILGTGVGGGIVIEKQLRQGSHAVGGEIGHSAAPANIVSAFGLPMVQCRCGRLGCIETLASGPGLERLCHAMTGRLLKPAGIAERRYTEDDVAGVWRVWCALVSELLLSISLCIEPDVFVLGGGLSQIPGISDDLSNALTAAHFASGAGAKIRLAEGGDASGARGAAYAAWRGNEGSS